MADSKGQYQKLPPGWDCKYDQATGNCYYINYLTKAMQLEDPRIRYKQLQNDRCSTESIPMQPVHGSPYHVYPSNNLPAMRAFQAGPGINPSLHNMSSSPLLSSRGQLEMSPLLYARSSQTQTPRLGNMSRRSTIQETSFSDQLDTNAVVNKIQNMFPTASEDHIRLLLRRYYNREAVVISALQVEKHPVTMPGPFVTPPAQRHLYHSNSAFHMTPPARRLDMGAAVRGHAHGYFGGGGSAVASCFGSSTSRTASPIPGGRFGSVMSMHSGGGGGASANYVATAAVSAMPFHHGSPRYGEQWRSSPKPHSSPKMKLRYMKNIFPKADEMLILDILAGADNNVQKASEELISMGYAKRDFLTPAKPSRNDMPKNPTDEKIIPLRPKEHSHEEKEAMQALLKQKYPQIAERIILMALESVNYAEDRAVQILHIVQEEDEAQALKHVVELETTVEQDEHTSPQGVTVVDAAGADNIITVVLETTAPNDNSSNNCNKNALDEQQHRTIAGRMASSTSKWSRSAVKKLTFPSINVTTPSTATTQILLSNSPICIENDAQPCDTGAGAVAKTLTSSAASTVSPVQETATDTTITTNISTTSTAVVPSSAAISSLSSPSDPPSPPPSSSTSYPPITTKSILAHSNSHTIGVNGYLHGFTNSTSSTSACILEKLKLSRPRDKSDSLKNAQRDSISADAELQQQKEFKSIIGRIATMGHNTELAKGANENLLLADYVTWNGANPDISMGHRQQAVGPDASKLGERTYAPLGRNPELCKGPKSNLAKGSIYAQPKSANIKCN